MQQADSFLDALRRPRPDPGGGSAAAHGALLGLAVLEKIFRIEQRRWRADSDEERSWRLGLQRVAELTTAFLGLRERDVRAYHGLTEAIAKGERDAQALAAALEEAIACPLEIMLRADEALDLVTQAGKRCKPFLVADVQVAGEFMGAALVGAFHIASANVPLIAGEAHRREWLERLTRARARGQRHLAQARKQSEPRHAAGR